jgi:site-specific DNA-methyltransferase (adenine-specific)
MLNQFIISLPKDVPKPLIIKDKHLLINSDNLKILPNLPSKSIDLIITDPPYNKGLNYGKYSNDNLDWKDYFEKSQKWLTECARILKDNGSIYLINYPEINARLLPFIEDNLKLKFRRWITWHYPTNIGHSKKNFTRSQRSILYFTKSDKYVFNRIKLVQHYKNPEVKKIKERLKKGSKGRTSYDLLRFVDLIELSKGMIDVLDINLLKNTSKDRLNKKHPCQLPLPLLRILVQASSNKNDIVLDPFAGTFTLSEVANELGRQSIGIEVNPKYINLGISRINSQ